MFEQRMYVDEKLRDFEAHRQTLTLRAAKQPTVADPAPPRSAPDVRTRQRRPRRVLGPIARATGSRVRRVGEALESWSGTSRTGDPAR